MQTTAKTVRAAAVQIAPVFLDKTATTRKLASSILEAGRNGARLVVTPETLIPGYPYWRGSFGYTDPPSARDWKDTVIRTYENSVSIPGPETEILAAAARQAGAYCVVGVQERDDRPGSQTLYNTMIFLSPAGRVMGRHRKLMPTHQERIFWGQGQASDLRVFPTDIGRLGGLICFENHMTLLKAAMAVKGEEIHAAGWPGWWVYDGPHRSVRNMTGKYDDYRHSDQDSAIREYAFETQTFVVSASMIQPPDTVPDDFPFKDRSHFESAIGGSAIVNPFGQYLVEPVFNTETIIYADLDLSERIVAKNVFDAMGHYSRWDVVSLNLRGEDWEPVGPAPVGNPTVRQETAGPGLVKQEPCGPAPEALPLTILEDIARRHGLAVDQVARIAAEFRRSESD